MVSLRTLALGVAAVLVAAACTAPAGPEAGSEGPGGLQDHVGADGLPEGPSALQTMTDSEFPEPLVDTSQIISGGPPPDGIPPIDEPAFVSVAAAAQWLADAEPVVAVDLDGPARAYPVQVLMWHEIVNDTIAGVPVAVSYCPLCNTAISFVRTVRDVEVTFGTSGRLFNSALVMYDRATESLWTHFDGRAVVGLLTGEQLEIVPSPLLAWSEFASTFPDGQVLDRDRTGFARRYGENPYTGYDRPDAQPFLFRGDVDERARAMQRVVGVERPGQTKAWTLEAISSDAGAAVTHDEVDGDPVVILWKAGQATALETGSVTSGRDVGSVGVFVPEADGQALIFEADGDEFVDVETGSTWTVTGNATRGPLEGETLERLHHFDTFWFAWASYKPDTVLVEETA